MASLCAGVYQKRLERAAAVDFPDQDFGGVRLDLAAFGKFGDVLAGAEGKRGDGFRGLPA